MNSLIRSLTSSLVFIWLASSAFGQDRTKKYIKKNRKAPIVAYGDSSIYARGLYLEENKLFIGNSDGSIIYLDLVKQKPQLLFQLPHINEIRDLEKGADKLYGMHSGDDGKLVQLDLKGGAHIIYIKDWQGVFLDGIDIEGNTGFMMGDPIDGNFSLFHSTDSGETWQRCKGQVKAFKGEAAFAASGSTVRVINDSTFLFVTGGEKSRFFKSTDSGATWNIAELPYYPGESTGPYSMCFANDLEGVIVGGDYKDPSLGMNSCFYTKDGGATWFNAMNTVRGYRSCVYFKNGVYYACGRNGIDFSLNGGLDWIPFADGTYFSLIATKDKLIATKRFGAVQIFDLIQKK